MYRGAAGDGTEEDVLEGVQLGTEPLPRNHESAEDYSVTRAPTTGVTIYTHGCSLRLRLKVDPARAAEALAGCGWLDTPHGSDWIVSRPSQRRKRWVMRGSKWLDERPPRNVRLPLVGWNTLWKTRLYSLGIERDGEIFHLDLQVIRHRDVRKFMEDVLGLGPSEYEVAYFRTIERYTTLAPHVAHALAEDLEANPVAGRGRQGRKRWLVRDHPVPMVVRKTAQVTANLFVYRIDRGATAHYRAEIRLCGKRRDRGTFHETDVARLDAILLDLIRRYDVSTVPKPARWEPRTFTTPVEQGAFDPYVRRLPQRAWRGSRVREDLKKAVERCHTPEGVGLLVSERNHGVLIEAPRIRSNIRWEDAAESINQAWERRKGGGFNVTHYVRCSDASREHEVVPAVQPPDAYLSVAADIARTGLYLHEVVLDADECPSRTIDALANGSLGRVGVAALCAFDQGGHAETWPSVKAAVQAHPIDDGPLHALILVVDPSAVGAVTASLMGAAEHQLALEEEGDVIGDLAVLFSSGPLPQAANDPSSIATAAWLDAPLRELRSLGEETGLRIVVVTCDARPEHAHGALRPGHFINDSRVRSSIGDAGRYYAHQRYRVERWRKTRYLPARVEQSLTADGDVLIEEYAEREIHEYAAGAVVVIKDEAEGLTGRVIFRPTCQA